MKVCSECGAKNLNSASVCGECGGALVESVAVKRVEPESDHDRMVLLSLDRLERAVNKMSDDRRTDLSMVSMSITDMAVLHFKLFVSALPLVATLFVIGYVVWQVVKL